jgi:hypothetical protein
MEGVSIFEIKPAIDGLLGCYYLYIKLKKEETVPPTATTPHSPKTS